MANSSQKNSRIFEFYKRGLLTKVIHIHSFQLFSTLLVILLPFFWGIGQDQIVNSLDTEPLTENDSISVNKAMLLDQIKRNAVGTITINRAKKTMTLYDKAELYYQDIELKAGQIDLDYKTNIVFARPIVDTTGQYVQFPSFKQGGDEVFSRLFKIQF